MKNYKLNQNNEVTFPEETVSIIHSLVIKYGLPTARELFKKFRSAKTIREKKELIERFKNLPGHQIAKTVKEVSQDKIRDKDSFITVLKEHLNIPEKTAKELGKDLEEKVLSLVQITFKEREKIPTAKEMEKTKPTLPRKPDTYREPIE